MNPRNLGNFLKSKFGLFVVFVAVLFSGLAIYGKHQSNERAAARLAAANAKKVELGQVQVPLNQGLEDGMPQEARSPAATSEGKDAKGDGLVPFHPVASDAKGSKATVTAKAPPPPRKIRYASLLASYQAPSADTKRVSAEPPERFMPFGTLLMVLSIIGDGSDDQQAAERLGISPHTVNTHRKAITAKLKLHHKGQLMLYAVQHGYIWVTGANVYYPGFQRRLQAGAKAVPNDRASA